VCKLLCVSVTFQKKFIAYRTWWSKNRDKTRKIDFPKKLKTKRMREKKESTSLTKKYCVICGGEERIMGYAITAQNIERYEEYFGHKLEFGPMCNRCYETWYRNTQRNKRRVSVKMDAKVGIEID
jgi:hypothetical protein